MLSKGGNELCEFTPPHAKRAAGSSSAKWCSAVAVGAEKDRTLCTLLFPYLVDPTSRRMLLPRTKPCTSQMKRSIQQPVCEWLITPAIISAVEAKVR